MDDVAMIAHDSLYDGDVVELRGIVVLGVDDDALHT